MVRTCCIFLLFCYIGIPQAFAKEKIWYVSTKKYQLTNSKKQLFHLFRLSKIRWQASAGPGLRENKSTLSEPSKSFIGHLESAVYFEITQQTSFKHSFRIDSNPKQTKSYTLNELKTSLGGPLAAKLSYEVKNDTHLFNISNNKNTKAITKLCVSYRF